MTTPLPVNIDDTYADDAGNPGAKAHQEHHDLLHKRHNGGMLNVFEFGAVGDGVTDDTTAISTAMDAMNSTGKTLYFPPTPNGYRCGSITKLYAPRIVSEGARIISTVTNGMTWTFRGTVSAGNFSALTANATAGSKTLPVANGALFAVGDYVIVQDDEVVPDAQYSPGQSGYYRFHGQMVKLAAVSGNTLTAEEPMLVSILSGSNGGVLKVNAIHRSSIRGLRFENPSPVGTKVTGFLRFDYAVGVDLDVDMWQGSYSGVYLRSVFDFEVKATCNDFVYNAGNGQYSYGVLAAAACNHGLVNVSSYNGANAFSTTGEDGGGTSLPSSPTHWHGEPANITITGVNSGSSTIGFSTHPSGRQIEFNNIHVVGVSGDGIQVRSPGVKVEGGRIEFCSIGVVLQDQANDCEIKGVRIREVTNHGISSLVALSGNSFMDNDIAECGRNGIRFGAAPTDVTIKNNRIRNIGKSLVAGAQRCISLETGAAVRLRVSDNTAIDTTGQSLAGKTFIGGAAATSGSVTFNNVHSGLGISAPAGLTVPAANASGANFTTSD